MRSLITIVHHEFTTNSPTKTIARGTFHYPFHHFTKKSEGKNRVKEMSVVEILYPSSTFLFGELVYVYKILLSFFVVKWW